MIQDFGGDVKSDVLMTEDDERLIRPLVPVDRHGLWFLFDPNPGILFGRFYQSFRISKVPNSCVVVGTQGGNSVVLLSSIVEHFLSIEVVGGSYQPPNIRVPLDVQQ